MRVGIQRFGHGVLGWIGKCSWKSLRANKQCWYLLRLGKPFWEILTSHHPVAVKLFITKSSPVSQQAKTRGQIKFITKNLQSDIEEGQVMGMSWEGQAESVRMRLDVYTMFQDFESRLRQFLVDG